MNKCTMWQWNMKILAASLISQELKLREIKLKHLVYNKTAKTQTNATLSCLKPSVNWLDKKMEKEPKPTNSITIWFRQRTDTCSLMPNSFALAVNLKLYVLAMKVYLKLDIATNKSCTLFRTMQISWLFRTMIYRRNSTNSSWPMTWLRIVSIEKVEFNQSNRELKIPSLLHN